MVSLCPVFSVVSFRVFNSFDRGQEVMMRSIVQHGGARNLASGDTNFCAQAVPSASSRHGKGATMNSIVQLICVPALITWE